MSQFITYTTFPLLSAAVLASETLRAACRRFARHGRIIADAAIVAFEERPGWGRLILEPVPGLAPADEAVDAVVSLELRVARLLLENPMLTPTRVDLRRDEPSLSEPFRAFFGAPIAFRARRNVLEFTASDLDEPLPGRNRQLSSWGDVLLEQSVARLTRQQIVRRVQSAVIDRLPDGEIAQEIVAKAVGVSVRTLHRRLAEVGTTYKSLLTQTRMYLAQSYVAEGRTVTEAALAVGFSSVSAFSRAFRSWAGRPPSEEKKLSFKSKSPHSE